MKIVNIDKLSKENNPMIQRLWMYMISRQSMPPSFEEIEDEDEAQSPSQPLGSYQGNYITLFYISLCSCMFPPHPPLNHTKAIVIPFHLLYFHFI